MKKTLKFCIIGRLWGEFTGDMISYYQIDEESYLSIIKCKSHVCHDNQHVKTVLDF